MFFLGGSVGACIEIFFSEEMGKSRACIRYISDEYKLDSVSIISFY